MNRPNPWTVPLIVVAIVVAAVFAFERHFYRNHPRRVAERMEIQLGKRGGGIVVA